MATFIQTRDNAIGLLQSFIRQGLPLRGSETGLSTVPASAWVGPKGEPSGSSGPSLASASVGNRHGPGIPVHTALPAATDTTLPITAESNAVATAEDADTGPSTFEKRIVEAGLQLRGLLRRQQDTHRELLAIHAFPDDKPFLKRNPEPARRRTHWDSLQEEATWAATDMHHERRWKIAAARGVAHEAAHVVSAGLLPWILRTQLKQGLQDRLRVRRAAVGKAVAAASDSSLSRAALELSRPSFSIASLAVRQQLVAVRAVQLQQLAQAALAIPLLSGPVPSSSVAPGASKLYDAYLTAPLEELVDVLRGAAVTSLLGTPSTAAGPSASQGSGNTAPLMRACASAAIAAQCANIIWAGIQRAALAFFATYGRAAPTSLNLDVSGLLAFRPNSTWGLQFSHGKGTDNATNVLLSRPAVMAGLARGIASASTVWLNHALRLVGPPLSGLRATGERTLGGLRAVQYALARGVLSCWMLGAPALIDGDTARTGVGRTTCIALSLGARTAELIATAQTRASSSSSALQIASLIVCDVSALAQWVTATLLWATGHEILILSQPSRSHVTAYYPANASSCNPGVPNIPAFLSQPSPRICIVTTQYLVEMPDTSSLSPIDVNVTARSATKDAPAIDRSSPTWNTVVVDLRRSDVLGSSAVDADLSALPCQVLRRLGRLFSQGSIKTSTARCVVLPGGGSQLDQSSLALAASPVSGVRLASLAFDTNAEISVTSEATARGDVSVEGVTIPTDDADLLKQHRSQAAQSLARGTAFRIALAGFVLPLSPATAVHWAVCVEPSVAPVNALALPDSVKRTDSTASVSAARASTMSDSDPSQGGGKVSSWPTVSGAPAWQWLDLARDSGLGTDNGERSGDMAANSLGPVATLAAYRILGRALASFSLPLPMPVTVAEVDGEAPWRPAFMERRECVPVSRLQARTAAVSIQTYAAALHQNPPQAALNRDARAPAHTGDEYRVLGSKVPRLDGLPGQAAALPTPQTPPTAPTPLLPPERAKPTRAASVAAPLLRRWLGLPVADSVPYAAYALRMGIAQRLPDVDTAAALTSLNWRTSFLALHLASQHGRLGDPAFLAEVLSSAAKANVLASVENPKGQDSATDVSFVDHGCLLESGPASYLPLPVLMGCGLYRERLQPTVFLPAVPLLFLDTSRSADLSSDPTDVIENALLAQIETMQIDSSGCTRALMYTSTAGRSRCKGFITRELYQVEGEDERFYVRWEPRVAVSFVAPMPGTWSLNEARRFNSVAGGRLAAQPSTVSVRKDDLPPLLSSTSGKLSQGTRFTILLRSRLFCLKPLACEVSSLGRTGQVVYFSSKVQARHSSQRKVVVNATSRGCAPAGWFTPVNVFRLDSSLLNGSVAESSFGVSRTQNGRVIVQISFGRKGGHVPFALLAATAAVVAVLPSNARIPDESMARGELPSCSILPCGVPFGFPYWDAARLTGVREHHRACSALLSELRIQRRPFGADASFLCRQSGKLMAVRALLQEANTLGRSVLLVAHCAALVDAAESLAIALGLRTVRLDEPHVSRSPATSSKVNNGWSCSSVARFNALASTRGRIVGLACIGVPRALAAAVGPDPSLNSTSMRHSAFLDRAAALASGFLGADVNALAVRTLVIMDAPLLPWSPALMAVERRLVTRMSQQRAPFEQAGVDVSEIASRANSAAAADDGDGETTVVRSQTPVCSPPSSGLLSVLRLTTAAPSLEAAFTWAASVQPKFSVLSSKLRSEAEAAYNALALPPRLSSDSADVVLAALLHSRAADVSESLRAAAVAANCLSLITAQNRTAAALSFVTHHRGASDTGLAPDLRIFASDHSGSSKIADFIASLAHQKASREAGAAATDSGARLLRTFFPVRYTDGMPAGGESASSSSSRGRTTPSATMATALLSFSGWGSGTLTRGRLTSPFGSSQDPLDYKRLVPEVLAFTDLANRHQDAGGLHFSHAFGPPHPEVKLVRAPPAVPFESAVTSAARVSMNYLENSLPADQNRFPGALQPRKLREKPLPNPTLLPDELRLTVSDAAAPRWPPLPVEPSAAAAAAADGCLLPGGGSSFGLGSAADNGRTGLQQQGSLQLHLQRTFSSGASFAPAQLSAPAVINATRIAASAAAASAASSRTGHLAAEAHAVLVQLQKSAATIGLTFGWSSASLGDASGESSSSAPGAVVQGPGGPPWPGGEDPASAALFSYEADSSAFPAELCVHLPGATAAALLAVAEAAFAPVPTPVAPTLGQKKELPASNPAVVAALARGYGTDRFGRQLTGAVLLPLSVISGEAIHAALRACPHVLLRPWVIQRPAPAPPAAAAPPSVLAAACPQPQPTLASLGNTIAVVESSSTAPALGSKAGVDAGTPRTAPVEGPLGTAIVGSPALVESASVVAPASGAPSALPSVIAPALPPVVAAASLEAPSTAPAPSGSTSLPPLAGRKRRHGDAEALLPGDGGPSDAAGTADVSHLTQTAQLLLRALPLPLPGSHHYYSPHLHDGALVPAGQLSMVRRARQLLAADTSALSACLKRRQRVESWQTSWIQPEWRGSDAALGQHSALARSSRLSGLLLGRTHPVMAGLPLNLHSLQQRGVARSQLLSAYLLPSSSYVPSLRPPVVLPPGASAIALPVPLGALTPAAAVVSSTPPAARPLPAQFTQHMGQAAAWGEGGVWDSHDWSATEDLLLLRAIWELGSNWDVVRDAMQVVAPIPGTLPGALGSLPQGCFALPPRSRPHRTARHCYDRLRRLVCRQVHLAAVLPPALARSLTRGSASSTPATFNEPLGHTFGVGVPLYSLGSNVPLAPRRGRANAATGFSAGQYSQTATMDWSGGSYDDGAAARVRAAGVVATRDLSMYATLAHAPAQPAEVRLAASVIGDCMRARPQHMLPQVISDNPAVPLLPSHVSQMSAVAEAHAQVCATLATQRRNAAVSAAHGTVAASGGSNAAAQAAVAAALANCAAAESQRPALPTGASILSDTAAAAATGYAAAAPALLAVSAPTVVSPAVPVSRFSDIAAVMLPEGLSHYAAAYAPRFEPYRKTSPYILSLRGRGGGLRPPTVAVDPRLLQPSRPSSQQQQQQAQLLQQAQQQRAQQASTAAAIAPGASVVTGASGTTSAIGARAPQLSEHAAAPSSSASGGPSTAPSHLPSPVSAVMTAEVILNKVMALPTFRNLSAKLTVDQVRAMLVPLIDDATAAAVSAVYSRRDCDLGAQERLVAQIINERMQKQDA